MSIYILGKGGTGKEISSLLNTSGLETFFLDDMKKCDDIVGFCSEYPKFSKDENFLISGLGSYKTMNKRKLFLESIAEESFYSFIHKSAIIYNGAYIKKPHLIFPQSIVATDVCIGKHVLIYHNTVISHDCNIGDFSIISNQTTISGNVSVGENCYIGAGAVVLENIKIGKNSIVAAGAVVNCDVPEDSIYINKNKIKRNQYL